MLHRICRRFSTRKIQPIAGAARRNTPSKETELRGFKLNSPYEDNPNMIFFVDYLDRPENWLPWFMNSGVLNYRNVYVMSPPNFGNSDYHHTNDIQAIQQEDTSNTIERFMYNQKISTATVGGHGFGARYALQMACFRPDLTTGFVGVDYTPLDYNTFDLVHRIKESMRALGPLTSQMRGGNMTRKQIDRYIEEHIEHGKMQALFKQNVTHVKDGVFDWAFNFEFFEEQLPRLVDWKTHFGLYPGRTLFAFPEYSDYVFLGSHSLAMQKIAPRTDDLGRSIGLILSPKDEVFNNHFMYEDADMGVELGLKMQNFIRLFDGVHPLLMSRRDVYDRSFIPARIHDRNDGLKEDHFPNHFHHNWRFVKAE